MKVNKHWIGIWSMVIVIGIGIEIYPFLQRMLQKEEQKNLIEIYMSGEMPSEEMLQGKNMLGVLWIPEVSCLLPIFEGTYDEVLQSGAGHMEGSSDLTDAATAHTVLCAHSGLPELYAFDRIDDLNEGDEIYIFCHNQTLEYRVTNQSMVLPEEVHLHLQTSLFANQLTLLTCTPYGINTHRLLVQAKLSRHSDSGSAA